MDKMQTNAQTCTKRAMASTAALCAQHAGNAKKKTNSQTKHNIL